MIEISKKERVRLQNLIYEWKRMLYAPEYALSLDNNYGEKRIFREYKGTKK
jgi:hypothetical protein